LDLDPSSIYPRDEMDGSIPVDWRFSPINNPRVDFLPNPVNRFVLFNKRGDDYPTARNVLNLT
jgi:hypothetical protein